MSYPTRDEQEKAQLKNEAEQRKLQARQDNPQPRPTPAPGSFKYTLWTDAFGKFEVTRYFYEPKEAIRYYAYMKLAYPGKAVSLQDADGFILDSRQIAHLAAFIILDDVPDAWLK